MSVMSDKYAKKRWDAYIKALRKATSVDMDENPHVKEQRIDRLLDNPLEFFKYYFPHYCKAGFHPEQTAVVKKAVDHPTIYAVLEWARGHAKSSTVAPMLAIYLAMKEGDINLLMVSYNETNAVELLKPIRLELEKNQRIINDFGPQVSPGSWEEKKFVTQNGCSFRAIGSGQSPRGTREEEVRPNCIICDDLDEDEMLRNPRRLDQNWEWVTGALYNCFDIKGKKRFFVINNRIAKDCILARAAKLADYHSVVNALKKAKSPAEKQALKDQESIIKLAAKNDLTGERQRVIEEARKLFRDGYIPSWHANYSLLEIAYIFLKIGYRMFQREYMNNPITEGRVFKRDYFQYKKFPPASAYLGFMVSYLDPSFKSKKTSDSKSWVLIGLLKGEFHIIRTYCDRTTTEEMIEWGYLLDDLVKRQNGTCRHIMEEVFLQDLLYKDFAAVATRKNRPLSLVGDKRKKPDKDARILAMEGYFQRGSIWFNELEKESHHQIRFEEQLLDFEPGVNTLKDGPDALEGGIYKLNELISLNADIDVGNRAKSTNRV